MTLVNWVPKQRCLCRSFIVACLKNREIQPIPFLFIRWLFIIGGGIIPRVSTNLFARTRSGHLADFVKVYIQLVRWLQVRAAPRCTHTDRLVRAKTGTAARVHARACHATRFQPLRNKSSEENLPEGINVGVGSPRVLCPFSHPGEG